MKNHYGVDVPYFRKELKFLLKSLDNRPAAELARYLESLAETAYPIKSKAGKPQDQKPHNNNHLFNETNGDSVSNILTMNDCKKTTLSKNSLVGYKLPQPNQIIVELKDHFKTHFYHITLNYIDISKFNNDILLLAQIIRKTEFLLKPDITINPDPDLKKMTAKIIDQNNRILEMNEKIVRSIITPAGTTKAGPE